jgi:RHS repeat-associated protein
VAKDASGAVLDDRSWVYDGQLRVIAEVSAGGALRARYLYASSGHSPDLAVTFDPDSGVVTGSYLLVHDQIGSVVRTVDLATGSAAESVAYDPWGVATVTPGGTAVHPFGFAGGLWDRRTGLVRFGAREYDAGLGRWLARDPIGFAGGWNHYGYAGGDPVGRVDPDGLKVRFCRKNLDTIGGGTNIMVPFLNHTWYCTDKRCSGVNPEHGYPNFGKGRETDERNSSGSCEERDDIDEECLDNSFSPPGSSFGPYALLFGGRNCQDYTDSLTAKCSKKPWWQGILDMVVGQ